MSLVCTNINSMMGGQANMWANGKGKPAGLVDPVGKTIDNQTLKFDDNSQPGDDILEFESLASIVHLSLGKCNRVA